MTRLGRRGLVSSTTSGGVVITDTFTGTAGTTLAAYDSPDHAFTWVQHPSSVATGNAVISDANRVRMGQPANSGNNANYLDITPATPNYSVAADFVVVSIPATINTGVLARCDTTATTFYLGRYLLSAQQWQISRALNNAFSTIGTQAGTTTLTVSQTYAVELICNGNQISLKVNGVTVVGPITNTDITVAAKPGIRPADFGGTNTTGIHFDNWTYTAL